MTPPTPAQVEALAAHCAPAVSPSTLVALASTESGFEPLAIGVNGLAPRRFTPSTTIEATRVAERLIQAGRSVDLGLLQINSANLAGLGLSVAQAFDVCRNLQAGARILLQGYRRADPRGVGAQAALRVALSYYNTGRPDRGFSNGYVARVTNWTPPPESRAASPSDPSPPAAPPRPAWDVFGRAGSSAAFVITPTAEGALP